MSSLTRAQREELKALSKEVFGVSSKYQKLLTGVPELVTKEVTEEVPGEMVATVEGGELKATEPQKITKKVPVLDTNGAKTVRIKTLSFEEVKAKLLDFKAKRDAAMEEYRKQQAELQAKREQEALQQKVQEELSGSSVG